MRPFFIALGLLIVFSSCHKNNVNKGIQADIELNEIVDELLRFRFPHANLVQIETKPVLKNFISKSKDSIPEPPPPGLIIFNKEYFLNMKSHHLIDSIDADYMFSKIDSTLIYRIDLMKVSKSVISRNSLNLILKKKDLDTAYRFIDNKYGSSCFIRISTPIFNKEFTKAVIAVDYNCGPLNGSGFDILLEKRKGKWLIINESCTWAS
jgi:hypothetical protein